MNEQPNTKTAPQLVAEYNALVRVAINQGLTGYRELRIFHDRATALARIAALEGALRARAEGERAEERRGADAGRGAEEQISPCDDAEFGMSDPVRLNDTKTEEENKVKKIKSKKKADGTPRVKKIAAAKARSDGHVVRAGSKTEVVRDLLTRKGGCTSREVLDATGWPAVSMPAMAKACGLRLRKEKEKGSATQYYGE